MCLLRSTSWKAVVMRWDPLLDLVKKVYSNMVRIGWECLTNTDMVGPWQMSIVCVVPCKNL